MQKDNIINKAKVLGIDTDSYSSIDEKLAYIASQVGFETFDPDYDLTDLENVIDWNLKKLQDYNRSRGDHSLDSLDNKYDSFGEKAYNKARDKNGKYDSDYYKKENEKLEKEREEKLNKRNQKREERARNNNYDSHNKMRKNAENMHDKLTNLNYGRKELKNKLDGIESKLYRATHPIKAFEDKVESKIKEKAKDTGKKAAKAAGTGIKNGVKSGAKKGGEGLAKLAKLIASNPKVAFIILVVLLIIIMLIVFILIITNSVNKNGYYDEACNYNETTVHLKRCNTEETLTISLDEYVKGATYSYLDKYNYSDEQKKALMIIIKTNALSLGGYNSSSKTIYLDDCNVKYTNYTNGEYIENNTDEKQESEALEEQVENNDNIDYNSNTNEINEKIITRLDSLYKGIEEEIFISSSYTESITSLSFADSLKFDEEILDSLHNFPQTASYTKILNAIYNKNKNKDNDKDNEKATNKVNNRKNFFIGDSRTTGMASAVKLSDNDSVHAVAGNYSWFVGNSSKNGGNCNINAINCANDKLGKESKNIIIWMGINDIANVENYFKKYQELATGAWKDHYLYIVSVGYVDESKYKGFTNSAVDNFNNNMRSYISNSGLKNLIYVDLGISASEYSVNTDSMGIHYSNEVYTKVYNTMLEKIGSAVNTNSTRRIYKMYEFCTFYEFSDGSGNDKYWYPIGSLETTTKNGKLFASGDPEIVSPKSTNSFGLRYHPILHYWRNHNGSDLSGHLNKSNVIAALDGTVIMATDGCISFSYCADGYGNQIRIEHPDGNVTLYAHLYEKSLLVKVGDKVEQGQVIAKVGSTGLSTGAHLHFEVRVNGVPVNPYDYISDTDPRPVSLKAYKFNNYKGANDTKEYVCKTLLKSNFSKNATIGIMVNIAGESGFISYNVQGDYFSNKNKSLTYTQNVDSGVISRYDFAHRGPGGGGYGLAQWTYYSRKEGLYDLAKSKNKSIGDREIQIEYLLKELNENPFFKTLNKYMAGNYSAYDMAVKFCSDYESPKGSCNGRASQYITEISNYVNNGCK